MVRHCLASMGLCICLTSVLRAEENSPATPNKDLNALQGLWESSWGGGDQGDGTVFLPVLTKMVISGEQMQWLGSPFGADGSGKINLGTNGKRKWIRWTCNVKVKGQPETKTVEFTYQIKRDDLTLYLDEGDKPFTLARVAGIQKPLANAVVEFVEANGIRDGELLITSYRILKSAHRGPGFVTAAEHSVPMQGASIFHVQECELEKITVDQVRGLLNKKTSVVLAYRQDEETLALEPDELWQDVGPAQQDIELVASMLRPGTLVFVIPSSPWLPGPPSP